MKNNLNLAEESMAFVQKYGCPPVEIIEKAMKRGAKLAMVEATKMVGELRKELASSRAKNFRG